MRSTAHWPHPQEVPLARRSVLLFLWAWFRPQRLIFLSCNLRFCRFYGETVGAQEASLAAFCTLLKPFALGTLRRESCELQTCRIVVKQWGKKAARCHACSCICLQKVSSKKGDVRCLHVSTYVKHLLKSSLRLKHSLFYQHVAQHELLISIHSQIGNDNEELCLEVVFEVHVRCVHKFLQLPQLYQLGSFSRWRPYLWCGRHRSLGAQSTLLCCFSGIMWQQSLLDQMNGWCLHFSQTLQRELRLGSITIMMGEWQFCLLLQYQRDWWQFCFPDHCVFPDHHAVWTASKVEPKLDFRRRTKSGKVAWSGIHGAWTITEQARFADILNFPVARTVSWHDGFCRKPAPGRRSMSST